MINIEVSRAGTGGHSVGGNVAGKAFLSRVDRGSDPLSEEVMDHAITINERHLDPGKSRGKGPEVNSSHMFEDHQEVCQGSVA